MGRHKLLLGGRKLYYNKAYKQYVTACGSYKTATGLLRRQRFNLGKDEAVARQRKSAIQAKWLELTVKGYKYWPESEIDEMVQQGLIRRRARRIPYEVSKAISVYEAKKDPALQQYLNPDGTIKPEGAVHALRVMMNRHMAQDESVQLLMAQVREHWQNDPLGTLERIVKIGIAPSQLNVLLNTPSSKIKVYLNEDLENKTVEIDSSEAPIDLLPNEAMEGGEQGDA